METSLARAAADVVAAYLANNQMKQEDVPAFCSRVMEVLAKGHDAGVALGVAPKGAGARAPAVDPSKSVFDDRIICLEDGKPLKMLKRHLRKLGLSPEQYREKWNLPSSYPMVAPAYSAKRAAIARQTGLIAQPIASC